MGKQKVVSGDLGYWVEIMEDNGRVVRLVLEMGRGGEKETEREWTRGCDLQEQDFSNLMMRALRCEISDLNSETS